MTPLEEEIAYCVDVILKEAKEEERLIKQILYTMLSAYTNNPINLAINAPSGEGKTYVINKVGEKFPESDVMFLAGMTDKALFHRMGVLVTKNEESGQYEPVDEKIGELDLDVEEIENQLKITQDVKLKRELKNKIKQLENNKKDLTNNAKKLIDLSHKTLIFLDSPRPELFSALMPLLSHDKYEVEYEYADTHNGIKTKTNILRGWPAVIFAQALDYSHYKRFPEIQRRFIITNPKMTTKKYEGAIDLISDKYGLPDIAYQSKVVSDYEKNKTGSIIQDLKQRILELTGTTEPGKCNIMIPFNESIAKSLPRQKAFDMTTAHRFFTYLSFLPVVNSERRPKIIITDPANPLFIQIIPIATFEDLRESTYLMEYANGVRPYILEWYNEVFLTTYNKQPDPNSRVNSTGQELIEKRRGLTTRQLADATLELQKKPLSEKQILETYLEPLFNQNYIDRSDSELDKRSYIYYPVLIAQVRKLFEGKESTNLLQNVKIPVIESALFPDRQYLNSRIEDILIYSTGMGLSNKIIDHDKKEITVDQLIDRYYSNPEAYFEIKSENSKTDPNDLDSNPLGNPDENNIIKTDGQIDYVRTDGSNNELYKKAEDNIKEEVHKQEFENNLFDMPESNKFTSFCVDRATDPKGTLQYIKCPQCSFKNIYPEVIAHHIRYTHSDKNELKC